jgi:hypothetical protein
MRVLDRRKFLAWLRAKRPDEIVGNNRDCHTCPVARFYSEVTGGWEIVVFQRWGDYFIDKGDGGRPAPNWAANFFAWVDDDLGPSITAARAIELLSA